jgi:hypothetical protein
MLPDNVILATHIPNATNLTLGTVTAALTGNASGTAATVTGAAQTAITSLGTLTGLTVSSTVAVDVSSAAALILNSTANTPYMRFDHSDASKFTIGESSIVGGGSGYYDFYAVSGFGLRFFAAAGERMRIDTGGTVGIGITAPTRHPLHIKGGATTEFHMTNTNSGDGVSDGFMMQYDSNKDIGIVNMESGGDMYFGVDNNTNMTLLSGGNFGIGTTSPAYELHVADTATETAIAIQSNIGGTGSAVGGRLRLQLGAQSNAGSGQADAQAGDVLGEVLFEGQGTDYSYQGGALRVIVSTGDGTATRDEQGCDMIFGTIAVGANSQAEKMRLTAAGKVGIGTNAPTEQLDIRAGNNYVKIGEGSNSISQIEMSDSNPIFIQGWGSEIRFATGTYNNHKMTIQAGGNVGIGTTSPGSTLTVNGSVSKSSGSFRIPHPLDSLKETKDLVHSFIEGPQADLIYRGKVDLSSGTATVNIDTAAGMTEGTFAVLCDDVQCFTTNEYNWDLVKASVSGNTLTITSENSSSTATISWLVIGERKDPHMIDTEWTDTQGKVIVEPDQISE